MEIKVLYEDDRLLAIDKPAGLLVHADGVSKEETVVDWVKLYYPGINQVGESQNLKDGTQIDRPGIVHRLDRDTSGVMLIAKTPDSYLDLKSQFQDRVIEKAYLALCHGRFKDEDVKGVIDLPIGRSPGDFRQWSAQRGARGRLRAAVTEYFILEQGPNHCLLFCQPKTGRTHQIRVHLKAIHHPIVCDQLYAPNHPCIQDLNRQALHARAITWRQPNGKLHQVASVLPSDMQKSLITLNFQYRSE